METRKLGSTGLQVSAVALGCGNFGGIGSAPEFFGQGEDEAQAHALLDAAVDLGIELLDTANAYGGGRSESSIGTWLKAKGSAVRDRLLISSKVFFPVSGDPADGGLSRAKVLASAEASLRRLGVDHLDMYLIHQPDPDTPVEETLEALDSLVQSGKVRCVGACNITAQQTSDALGVSDREELAKFGWVQNSFSLLDRNDEQAFASLFEAEGLGYTPFSPLAGGLLTGKYRLHEDYPSSSRMTKRPEPYLKWWNEATFAGIDRLRDEAAQRNTSLPALALAWVLGQPFVSSMIVGPRRPEHLDPVRDALQMRLGADDCRRIGQLLGLGDVGETA